MRGLLDESGIMYIRWDFSRGVLLDVSASVLQILGYTREALLADPALAASTTHPDFVPKLQAMVAKWAVERPVRFQFEGQYVARGGREVWLEVVGVPEYSADGALVGAQALAVDVSDVVHTRREAEAGWRRYRALFEDAPLPMVLYDPETFLVLEANLQACHLFGAAREEFEGTFLEEHIAPGEWAHLEERLRRAIHDPRVHIVSRMVARRADGTSFPVQVASVNINQQGKSRRLAVLRDLTDAEIAEASLRSLRVAAESGGRALLILDRQRRVAFSNPAASELTGYSAEELHGQDPRLLVSDGFEEALWRGLEQAESGHPWKGKLAIEPPGGSSRVTDADVLPVTTLAGAVTHFVMVLREAPAGHPFPALSTPAPEPKEFFVGLLAQPISQSLAAIQMCAEQVLSSPQLPDELRPDVRYTVEQSTAALHLVREFEWVLGRHGDARAPARGAAADVVEAAIKQADEAMGERELTVRRDLRAERAFVRAPGLLGEALARVVQFAAATDSSDPVELDLSLVDVRRDGAPHVRLRLSGRGGPRTEEERARLFAYPSAGQLGARSAPSLSLARLLIEMMGGAVFAESRVPGDPAAGTAFIVTVPVAA